MKAKELARQITGSTYPFEPTQAVAEQAEETGLVIVFGASDDLMEFRGAIRDEVDAYEGAEAFVDSKGLLPHLDNIRDDDAALEDYFRRKPCARKIEALWAAEGGYSWTYRTDIPHETFEIVEDGEPYCRGIVFALSELDAVDTFSDAELVEAAALSIGLKRGLEGTAGWNPLAVNGQAWDLVVALGLRVVIDASEESANAESIKVTCRDKTLSSALWYGVGAESAIRRAIVRAAACIGRETTS